MFASRKYFFSCSLGSSSPNDGGAGGGSSYCHPAASNVLFTTGYKTGAGTASITFYSSPSSQPSGQPSYQPSSRPTLPGVSANLFMELIAGSGNSGYSGDNGPATLAHMYSLYPWVDSSGNIYVPDEYSYRIRKVTASNRVITTFGGNGTHSSAGISRPISLANFYFPTSVVGDPAGTALFLSDQLYVWK
jgi:hypothetical protein